MKGGYHSPQPNVWGLTNNVSVNQGTESRT